MFIILLRYCKPLEEIDGYLEAHRRFLESGYQEGVFICSGPLIPRTGGVIFSNLASKSEVDEMIRKDPFYQAGLAEYQIIEFTPRMKHPEFKF